MTGAIGFVCPCGRAIFHAPPCFRCSARPVLPAKPVDWFGVGLTLAAVACAIVSAGAFYRAFLGGN